MLKTILPLIVKGSRHKITLIGKGLDNQVVRRLDNNAGLRRSSLRLVVQDDTVFIMSYNAHGPVEHCRRSWKNGD